MQCIFDRIVGPPAPTFGRSGCGAAWLARLTGGQKVAGSNPVTPTFCKSLLDNNLRVTTCWESSAKSTVTYFSTYFSTLLSPRIAGVSARGLKRSLESERQLVLRHIQFEKRGSPCHEQPSSDGSRATGTPVPAIPRASSSARSVRRGNNDFDALRRFAPSRPKPISQGVESWHLLARRPDCQWSTEVQFRPRHQPIADNPSGRCQFG